MTIHTKWYKQPLLSVQFRFCLTSVCTLLTWKKLLHHSDFFVFWYCGWLLVNNEEQNWGLLLIGCWRQLISMFPFFCKQTSRIHTKRATAQDKDYNSPSPLQLTMASWRISGQWDRAEVICETPWRALKVEKVARLQLTYNDWESSAPGGQLPPKKPEACWLPDNYGAMLSALHCLSLYAYIIMEINFSF